MPPATGSALSPGTGCTAAASGDAPGNRRTPGRRHPRQRPAIPSAQKHRGDRVPPDTPAFRRLGAAPQPMPPAPEQRHPRVPRPRWHPLAGAVVGLDHRKYAGYGHHRGDEQQRPPGLVAIAHLSDRRIRCGPRRCGWPTSSGEPRWAYDHLSAQLNQAAQAARAATARHPQPGPAQTGRPASDSPARSQRPQPQASRLRDRRGRQRLAPRAVPGCRGLPDRCPARRPELPPRTRTRPGSRTRHSYPAWPGTVARPT